MQSTPVAPLPPPVAGFITSARVGRLATAKVEPDRPVQPRDVGLRHRPGEGLVGGADLVLLVRQSFCSHGAVSVPSPR